MTEGVGGRERDGPRFDRATGRIGSQQGRVEGLAEWGRHPVIRGIRDVPEKVAERCVGQSCLGFGTTTL